MAARLLRGLLRRRGLVLDRTGTRSALRFICTAPSGRTLRLPGGVRVSTEFEAARIAREPEEATPPDRPLVLDGAEGSGTATIGGRARRAAWTTRAGDGPATTTVRLDGAALPLVLRGWSPGDRMRTRGGTRTLKKLFGEARIPRAARARAAVLADASGAVLWVEGVARSAEAPRPGEPALTLVLD